MSISRTSNRRCNCCKKLLDQHPEHSKTLQSSLDWADKHHGIIAEFGRFPHRNEVLDRASTEAETNWLTEGGDRFGQ